MITYSTIHIFYLSNSEKRVVTQQEKTQISDMNLKVTCYFQLQMKL